MSDLPEPLSGSATPTHVVDPRYEFCAPQYLDFTKLMGGNEYDDDADKWFNSLASGGVSSPQVTPKPFRPKHTLKRSPSLQPTAEDEFLAAGNPIENQMTATETQPKKPIQQKPANAASKNSPKGRSKTQTQPKSVGAEAVVSTKVVLTKTSQPVTAAKRSKPISIPVRQTRASNFQKAHTTSHDDKENIENSASHISQGNATQTKTAKTAGPFGAGVTRSKPAPLSTVTNANRAVGQELRVSRLATQSAANKRNAEVLEDSSQPNTKMPSRTPGPKAANFATLTIPRSPQLSKSVKPTRRAAATMPSRTPAPMPSRAPAPLLNRTPAPKAVKASNLTIPKSPPIRKSVKRPRLTTEERTVMLARQEAEAEAKQRTLNNKGYRRILQSSAPAAVHSSRTLTQPREFRLSTASLKRKHAMLTRSMQGEEGAYEPGRWSRPPAKRPVRSVSERTQLSLCNSPRPTIHTRKRAASGAMGEQETAGRGPSKVHRLNRVAEVSEKIQLASDRRAAQRAEFDKKMAIKKATEEEERAKAEQLAKEEEKKALRQMRKSMVPRARKIPSNTSKPFCIRKSTAPLAMAKSPALSTRARTKSPKSPALSTRARTKSRNTNPAVAAAGPAGGITMYSNGLFVA